MIEWELRLKHPVTDEFVPVPFISSSLNMKFGMETSTATFELSDKAGYKFAWVQDAEELKLYKNDKYFYYGMILSVRGRFGKSGEKITINTEEYWHYILGKRLTTFERFGTVRNLNPTTLAKVAIGTHTFITEDGWEGDKIDSMKYGYTQNELDGANKLSVGVRNESYYTLMAYLQSVQWRVDEPSWQGSENYNSGYLTVTEALGSSASKFWFSRDDGETWYLLNKSALTNFTGSESVKDKGRYKISIYSDIGAEYTNIYDDNFTPFRVNPNGQSIVRTGDGTLHAVSRVTTVLRHFIYHFWSRDNGQTWSRTTVGALSADWSANAVSDIAIAVSPDGHLGISIVDDIADKMWFIWRKCTKNLGIWSWSTQNLQEITTFGSIVPNTCTITGFTYYDTGDTAMKDAFAITFQDNTATNYNSHLIVAALNQSAGTATFQWGQSWAGSGAFRDTAVYVHPNWGQNASSKRVMFFAESGRSGASAICRTRYATFTDGGSPSWSGWTTVDSGACYYVDIVPNRTHYNAIQEIYDIYIFYQKGTTLYGKSSGKSDQTTWTVFDVHSNVTGIVSYYWDVCHFVDNNFMFIHEILDTYYFQDVQFYRDGTWYDAGGYHTKNTSYYTKIAQHALHGMGDCVYNDTDLTDDLWSMVFYSSTEPSITAMELDLVTDSETGIQEGNMTSFVNADLDNTEVSYSMNRETRLRMLQDVQKMLPMAVGASSPYPFWDMSLREEDDICYLDIDEELGTDKEIIMGHPDEGEFDVPIVGLTKVVDRSDMINALTVAGGGWSSAGIEVIPIKNVATDGVEAGTELQLAGTMVNKRTGILSIENVAYTILNVTKEPRVTITCQLRGQFRDNFSLGDKVTVRSERYGIDQYLKVREMRWKIGNKKTTVGLVLDNGSKTLDKYLVQTVTNLNTIGFSAQGELTRPPIFLSVNFTADNPAILRFYVPVHKKTKKALLYIKTEKYLSSEAGDMTEFGYYPSDMRIYIDDEFCEEFGGRGNETTSVDIKGLDISRPLDFNNDGLIDEGEHEITFTSAPSTNNPNGLGRVEAYLVLLESDSDD